MIKDNKVYPKVSIVGAGPGDIDLLTIRALKTIKNADVILYDALVNKEILSYAPQAKKIFVGKRKGFHVFKQDQINELIVANAYKYGHVVRLKGGDPFVFGRGKEEANYVASFGIEVDIVSGISSAVAVPSSVGIPVTLREVATSFWVVTATNVKHQLSHDVLLAAQSEATVVILMGMGKLTEIVKVYKSFGRGAIPVAIIQNGTKTNEKYGVGTIENIEEIVALKRLSSPAVIVIGEVVRSIQPSNVEELLLEDEFIFQNLNL